jgi:hypothetical protein
MHRQETVALLAGVVGAARTHAVTGNTGGLSRDQGNWYQSLRRMGEAGVGGAHSTEEAG